MASLTASSGMTGSGAPTFALTQGRRFPLPTCAAVLHSSKLASGAATGIHDVCRPSGHTVAARGAADQRSHDPCQSSRLSTPGLPERSI